jgi:hypothetical protein
MGALSRCGKMFLGSGIPDQSSSKKTTEPGYRPCGNAENWRVVVRLMIDEEAGSLDQFERHILRRRTNAQSFPAPTGQFDKGKLMLVNEELRTFIDKKNGANRRFL